LQEILDKAGKTKSRHCFLSEGGKYLYHVGIIDYLQAYDWSKKGEHFLKSFKKGGDLISCIPPEPY